MERISTFKSSDGKSFHTAKECKRYEDIGKLQKSLAGRTEAQIWAAFNRSDLELGAALELAGITISILRREGGHLKRVPKDKKLP